MESIITENIFRNLLSLDALEIEKSMYHELFPNHSNYNYLFIGPSHSGRTSMLFEYAFQAVEHDMNVLYITQHPIEKLPHFIGSREQPIMKTLKLMDIIYPETVEEYIKIMCTIHLKTKKYKLLIIDDIDTFYVKENKNAMKIASKMCAFTFDAVTYLRKAGYDTTLLCSVTSSSIGQPTYMNLEDWFCNILYFYPSRTGVGFSIKTEKRTFSVGSNQDTVVKGVSSTFKDGRIFLE